jgi:hypothetical protein
VGSKVEKGILLKEVNVGRAKSIDVYYEMCYKPDLR